MRFLEKMHFEFFCISNCRSLHIKMRLSLEGDSRTVISNETVEGNKMNFFFNLYQY